jgi:hypothetical protein
VKVKPLPLLALEVGRDVPTHRLTHASVVRPDSARRAMCQRPRCDAQTSTLSAVTPASPEPGCSGCELGGRRRRGVKTDPCRLCGHPALRSASAAGSMRTSLADSSSSAARYALLASRAEATLRPARQAHPATGVPQSRESGTRTICATGRRDHQLRVRSLRPRSVGRGEPRIWRRVRFRCRVVALAVFPVSSRELANRSVAHVRRRFSRRARKGSVSCLTLKPHDGRDRARGWKALGVARVSRACRDLQPVTVREPVVLD